MPKHSFSHTVPHLARRSHLSLAISTLFCPVLVQASPQGGTVTSGQATIAQSGSVTTVSQSTQKASINWLGFSIASGETVNFVQPGSTSITLNRVIGNEASVIDGAMNANGRVFLVNSNGILFGSGSSINVGGLVASTLNISDAAFNSGDYTFTGGGGSVLNMGTITATDGGYVALLGTNVTNQGVIVATKGTVAMAGGDRVALNFNGDSLLSVSVDQGTLDALVDNKGAVYADGGTVVLTARAADELVASQVNNSGIIQARSIDDLTGSITLNAIGGTANVSGTLDASAPISGNGGFIETSGDAVRIADTATISTLATSGATGNWLIDPDGFTIGASGDITGAKLGSELASTNVTIASTQGSGTDGNITVTDAVSWNANTTLTLNATNNINIDNTITASGSTAGLVLNYGGYATTGSATSGSDYTIDSADGARITFSGAGASLKINGNSYTLINSLAQLAALDDATGSVSGYYALAGDLDASGTTYTSAIVAMLTGTFAGLGHTISNLTISGSTAEGSYRYGLIGRTSATAVVRDIGIVNTNVSGYGYVGALVGYNYGTISDAWSSGSVSGSVNVGGLVGSNYSATAKISNSHSSANVTGSVTSIGGLVGYNSKGTISNSYATGTVTGANTDTSVVISDVGGLVGYNVNGSITSSYATGAVTTSASSTGVGGLAGANNGATAVISNSYATGNVQGGDSDVGGLVGLNAGGATISGSHATGNVTGSFDSSGVSGIGGLVGDNSYTAGVDSKVSTITDSYSTGDVSGSTGYMGGLAGMNSGAISTSYSTGDVTGTSSTTAGGLVGYNSVGTISSSYATGDVSAGLAAGLVGANGTKGTVSDSHATGSLNSTQTSTNGLVGINDGTVNGGWYTDAAAQAAAEAAAQATATRHTELLEQGSLATNLGAGETEQARRRGAQTASAVAHESIASLHVQHPAPVEEAIVITDPAKYSATIRTIEVDGKLYQLDDDSTSAP